VKSLAAQGAVFLKVKLHVNTASFNKRWNIFSQIKKITTQAIKNNCMDYLTWFFCWKWDSTICSGH